MQESAELDRVLMEEGNQITLVASRLRKIEPLLNEILRASNDQEKLEILNVLPVVEAFVQCSAPLKTFLAGLNPDCELAIKSVIAIGEGAVVFNIPGDLNDKFERLRQLLQALLVVEKFYAPLGGIIGYHVAVLRLICEKEGLGEQPASNKTIRYLHPEGIDLSHDTRPVREAVLAGIERVGSMAEIYPVGGAGDRLNLRCEETGTPLPAAKLLFGGRTLLEGLVRDLQAREYLHYKLVGQHVVTPVAMMTSHEKDNDRYIKAICEESGWFNRPKESFLFFEQPLVPVISSDGHWCLSHPLQLVLKPGGHGVIWKLAHDNGVFRWFLSQGRQKALVRQINNPIAGTDYGMLAFLGMGCAEDKVFGFASCHRRVNTAEGVNVLIETTDDEGCGYCLTNIEYTDFAQRGIQDAPKESSSLYSPFPANTNILFVDVDTVEDVIAKVPVPGMLINMKSKSPYIDPEGVKREVSAGRLESMMQNIADSLIHQDKKPLSGEELLRMKTYITFNERSKTISVTKKSYDGKGQPTETPDGCYYDQIHNCHDLLNNACGMKTPPLGTVEDFLKKGPPFVMMYHPALGPLYSVIGQKIRGGAIRAGSELQLEITDLEMVNVDLHGSLLVEADSIMGQIDSRGVLRYSERGGKCELENVKIVNKGIDRNAKNIYWKNQIVRSEALRVILHGNAEFCAEDLVFRGELQIEVPDGCRMTAYAESGEIKFRKEKIAAPTWSWQCHADADCRIVLEKKKY